MDKTQAANFIGWTVLGNEALGAMFDLRWMLIFVIVLVLVDFWFGVKVSNKKQEEIRWSRAWRRTANKVMDYSSYLLLGAVLGMAICEPLGVVTHTVTAAVGILLGSIFEVQSIVSHVCYLHDVPFTFNLWKFALAIVKSRSERVGNALEDSIEKDDE